MMNWKYPSSPNNPRILPWYRIIWNIIVFPILITGFILVFVGKLLMNPKKEYNKLKSIIL